MHTNKLKKEQIFPMMRGCLIKMQADEDPDEALKVSRVSDFPKRTAPSNGSLLQDLIDMLIKKLDIDRDGVINESEFQKAVLERDLLLLESMGPVFPSRRAQWTFLNTFTLRPGRF